ncbi:MAG: DUF4307 domain-containing protein [Mycobacteriales bacterium]|jgi:hypothetical protein
MDRQFLADRYGRRYARPSPRWVLPVLVAVVVVAGVLIALGMYRIYDNTAAGRASGEVTRFAFSEHGADATVRITKPSGDAAHCVVRARDRAGAEIGRYELAVPATGKTYTAKVHVPTPRTPTVVEVYSCAVDSSG